MGKKRNRPEPSLDAIRRAGIYQRTCGPHKPGAISQLEQWERHAVHLLERFAEQEVPDDTSIGFPVCGQLRFFEATTPEVEDHLCKLSRAFWALNDAFRVHDELVRAPSVEAAERLTCEAMMAIYFATEIGAVSSRTWQLGESRYSHAEKMREAKAMAQAERDREKRMEAESAIEWARKKFPTAAHDNYLGKLKKEAAGHLGISPDTLERWLKISD